MNENNQIHVWDLFVRVFHWSLVVFLIFVHIMGVAVSSMRHSENLVRAMFTGKKSLKVS